jgi:hypothetical protein
MDATRSATRLATGRRLTAYLLLLGVLGCVAAMSWAGLYSFARDTMGWSAWHATLVPIALDVAAMVCALLALDSIAKGETAATLRLLTACFVALSAWINWRTAIATGNVAEQLFFPAMSVLAYALVHAVMGKYRREVRRDMTGRQHRDMLDSLPRLGVAWLRYPKRAYGATSAAVARRFDQPLSQSHDGVSRGESHGESRRTSHRRKSHAGESQADAIRRGIAEAGDQPAAVVAWLESHGRPGVATQRVHDIIRRDRERPQLHSVGE